MTSDRSEYFLDKSAEALSSEARDAYANVAIAYYLKRIAEALEKMTGE